MPERALEGGPGGRRHRFAAVAMKLGRAPRRPWPVTESAAVWPSCQALLFSGPPSPSWFSFLVPHASFLFGFSSSGHEICLLGAPGAHGGGGPPQEVRARGSELNRGPSGAKVQSQR